jgi:hypothetical protein
MRKSCSGLMRSTPVALAFAYELHYYSPPVPFPEEYVSRVTNPKRVYTTRPRDPKNYWGLHNRELVSMHPSCSGLDRHNFSVYETKGGPICEIPPIPVYKSKVWCLGHHSVYFGHPRIFIKCPPGMVVTCKWCRVKFLNMATEEDNDENWKEEIHEIATTPEPLEAVLQVNRRIDGTLPPNFSNFLNPEEGPHPDVYKSVFNPEKYKWRKVNGKMVPPSKWRELEAKGLLPKEIEHGHGHECKEHGKACLGH